jgi:hypothetical protein
MSRTKSKWKKFKSARAFVRSIKIKNDAEWRLYCAGKLKGKGKKPDDIPTTPNKVYEKEGWVNLGDWLGTGNVSNTSIRNQYISFIKARSTVRKMGIKNRDEWQLLYKKGKIQKNIPLKPERVYADKGWVNCGDWFGTGYIAPFKREYWPYTKARAFVKKLKLKNRTAWDKYCKGELKVSPKKPIQIPSTPARVYESKGWVDWNNWLGNKK